MHSPDSDSSSSNETRQPGLPIEISVIETKELMDSGKSLLLLDCRENEEIAACLIEGAVHIPMREIPERLSEIENSRSDRFIIHCHHGGRSLQVAQWLRANGFPEAQNMTGGIDQWSLQVNPQVPRY